MAAVEPDSGDTDTGSHGGTVDRALLDQLRNGDESAFSMLVERYHPQLVRLATAFVADRATAEDVAQETWLGVLRGLAGFEGRSSLRTWIFRILVNRAKTRGVRDGRVVPFSDLWRLDDEPEEPAVAADRFQTLRDRQPGHWVSRPASWAAIPEERMLSLETRELVQQAIKALPPSQRTVVTLRDIEGWESHEVCNVLNISETNQRVLLHRARSRIRQALESYFAEE